MSAGERKEGPMTRAYQIGVQGDGLHAIEYLWSQLAQLLPADWPPGVIPTPRTHDRGTAGFPDGAGLYRKTGDPLPPFPVEGVMFVGHNTDAADMHASRRTGGISPGEPPNGRMPTWVRLYALFRHAGFDPHEMFFTNIYVGLKAGGEARGRFPGADDPSFCAWCAAFLDEQIQLMRPRAIVTLGDAAAQEFGLQRGRIESKRRAGVTFKAAALMHPSSGWLYRKRDSTTDRWIDQEARILKEVSTS
jgi:Uracil DNA glycosylase superfamily